MPAIFLVGKLHKRGHKVIIKRKLRGKNKIRKEDLSKVMTAIAREAAKKAAKEATKELKKKKKTK